MRDSAHEPEHPEPPAAARRRQRVRLGGVHRAGQAAPAHRPRVLPADARRGAASSRTTRSTPRSSGCSAPTSSGWTTRRGATARCQAPGRASAAAARRVPLGPGRARQELPDGQLLPDRAAGAEAARALPPLHARRPPRDGDAQGPRGSARRGRLAHREALPAGLLRRVPRERHRRRDDPRAAAAADHGPRRRVLHDLELSARTGSTRTACSASASCRPSRCSRSGSTSCSSDGDVDYRRRALEQVEVYHAPLGPEAERALDCARFRQVADVEEEFHELDVEGRVIPYRQRAGGVVWFDFDVLCGGPRSQLDYLDLAQRFHTVDPLERAAADSAQRRRTRRAASRWLVDVFYDAKVKLIVSADAPARGAVRGGRRSPTSSSAPRAG